MFKDQLTVPLQPTRDSTTGMISGASFKTRIPLLADVVVNVRTATDDGPQTYVVPIRLFNAPAAAVEPEL